MLQAMTQAARSASDAAPTLQALQVQQQCQLVTISIKPVVEWSDNLYNPLRSEDHEGDLSTWLDFVRESEIWLFLLSPTFGVRSELAPCRGSQDWCHWCFCWTQHAPLRCRQFHDIMTRLLRRNPLRMMQEVGQSGRQAKAAGHQGSKRASKQAHQQVRPKRKTSEQKLLRRCPKRGPNEVQTRSLVV